MKKLFFFLFFLLILLNFAEADIYGFLDFVNNNPQTATIAVDDAASAVLIVHASELAGEFGITNSIFISEIRDEPNLIIFQLGTNEKATMKFGNGRLSVLGNEEALIDAIDYTKDYEKHESKLSANEFSVSGGINFLPVLIILVIIIAGIVVWYFWKKRKNRGRPPAQPPVQPQKTFQPKIPPRAYQQPKVPIQQSNQKIMSILFLVLVMMGIAYIIGLGVTENIISGYASLYFNIDEDHNIYNLIQNTLENNSNIMIVVDRDTEVSEIEAASELSGFFGIIDSRFDDEVFLEGNQILIGSDNLLVNQLISWDLSAGEALIQLIEQGDNVYLIVAGTEAPNTQQAVDIIIAYDFYEDELQTDCIKIKDDTISNCIVEQPPSGNGGGGGGGSRCNSVWECTPWSNCVDNIQTRACTDIRNCGTANPPKPAETQSCTCSEDWICGEWQPEECPASGKQTRTCGDWNNCGTELLKPDTERNCEYVAPIKPVEEKPGVIQINEDVEINVLIPILFLVLVVVVAVFFVYKKFLIGVKVPDTLSKYVKKELDAGFSEAEIRDALLKRRWDKKVVDKVMKISK